MKALKEPWLAVVIAFVWIAAAADGSALACTVNGVADTTIAAALKGSDPVINFSGTCSETIFIRRDGVTINGVDPPTSVIEGEVTVTAAKGVTLSNLTVTGNLSSTAGIAVLVRDGAQAFLDNVNIDAKEEGMYVLRLAEARLENTKITTRNSDVALGATDSSMVMLYSGNTITLYGDQPNACCALAADRNSEIRLAGGSTVTVLRKTETSAVTAVSLYTNAVLRVDNLGGIGGTSTPHGPNIMHGDLELHRHSVADIRDLQISGNIRVNIQSVLALGATHLGAGPVTVNGNITVNGNSIVEFVTDRPSVSGDIKCVDPLSRITGTAKVSGKITCPSF
jgi:hypothetical protein